MNSEFDHIDRYKAIELAQVNNAFDFNAENASLGQKVVPLLHPDIYNDLAANRLFFQISDISCYYFGQIFVFDAFASEEVVTWHRIVSPVLSESYKDEILRAVFVERRVTTVSHINNFLGSLERITETTGRNKSSREAITVLHDIAQNRGRIAFVEAHGGQVGDEWRVFNYSESMSVNTIVADLGSRRDKNNQLQYQAIYLNSCNPNNSTLNLASDNNFPIEIPVIIHTGINEIYGGDARVFWSTT